MNQKIIKKHWLTSMPWLWRLMFRGENDLGATPFAQVLSYIAATVEWGAPLILIFSTEPILIWFALFMLISMHVYIIMLVPNDIHMWNWFTAVAGLYLFVGGHARQRVLATLVSQWYPFS